MLRCSQLHLHDEELKTMTVGMVFDMLIEKQNDEHKYPVKGDNSDIQRLFGG